MKRVFFIASFVCALLFQANFAFSQTPTITVSSATGNVGAIVDISITLKNNPGIVTMQLSVSYDSNILQLVNVVDGPIFLINNHDPNLSKDPYTLMWPDKPYASNIMSDGVLTVLSFKIIKEATNSPISVSYTNKGIANYNYQWLNNFAIVNGSVTGILPTVTWLGVKSSDWNNPLNWSSGQIPGATDKVIIPSVVPNFPILTPLSDPINPTNPPATVNEIHFAPGAELGRQDLLTYNKAFVQLDFSDPLSRNHWWMLANPLQELYVGDLAFGGNPGMYITQYRDDGTGTGKGGWMPPLPDKYNKKFAAGEDFQLWLNDNDLGTVTGLSDPYAGGIITLPHYEDPGAVNVYYNGADFTATHSPYAYKLTEVDGSKSFTRSLSFVKGQCDRLYFAATGNPFMSSISFDRLLADNNSLIEGTYWIWEGAGWDDSKPGNYVTYNSALKCSLGKITEVSTDGIFSPMQSFIVGQKAGATGTDITFNIENIRATKEGKGLRAAAQSKDLLEIIASTPQSAVRTVIASRENGGEVYNNLDSRRLSGGINTLPDLYMLKQDANNSVTEVVANVLDEINEKTVVPLVVSTTYEGQVKLSFTGMDTYNARIFLVDNDNKKEIEMTGQSRYEYTFNYAPPKVNGTVTANENRFFIQLSPTNSTGIRSASPNNILIYSNSANTIQVASGEIMQRVSVFNIQGQKVYDNASIHANTHTITGIVPGIYVVKAMSKNDLKTTKIIVK